MTLQTTGQISINDIGDEFEVAAANRSLATLSAAGGFTAPHGIKEFYGFSDTIPVSGIAFTGLNSSGTTLTRPYDINTVSTSGNPTLRISYTRTGTSSTAHTVGIFKNGTNINNFNSATNYTNGTGTFDVSVVNNDQIQVKVTNASTGTYHQATVQWINLDDNNTVLATDSFSVFKSSGNTGGGSGNYGCFPAGMMVTMADGSEKAIDTISEGDMVLASGMQSAEVLDVWTMPQESRLIFKINGKLRMTKDHPIKIIGPTTSTWAAMDPEAANEIHPELNIQQLEIGQTLVGPDGYRETVETIETQVEDSQVYNLNVSGDDTYFVQGLLVHNK
jgi:hypothetical protein